MKKPNVTIEGNGDIEIQEGGKFFMYGTNGEEIKDSVRINNSGQIISNDLNITGNATINNTGFIFSKKINIGLKKIENWAANHPWLFGLIFLILGFLLDIIRDCLL